MATMDFFSRSEDGSWLTVKKKGPSEAENSLEMRNLKLRDVSKRDEAQE